MAFYHSTIGKKVIVALTGLVMLGFVVGHMLGNLQVFIGPEKINDYAHALRSMPPVLWGTRIVLIVSVILHFFFTVQLSHLNKQSRPIAYSEYQPVSSSLASRTMIWGGVVIFFYIIYHLLHLTFGVVHPDFNHTDVYSNLVVGLSVWYVAIFYIVANVALGFHLYHGIWSVFQTLGLNHPKYNLWRLRLAASTSIIISAGYISIPLAIWTGIIK